MHRFLHGSRRRAVDLSRRADDHRRPLGILVGQLPGLGAPNGVSLLLPLTFTADPVAAIILLTSMYRERLFGGSTTSILFNIPGEPSSVGTTFDGYPNDPPGAGHAGADIGVSVGRFRRSRGCHPHHGAVDPGRQVCSAASARRNISPSTSWAFCELHQLGAASPFKTVVSMGLGFASCRRGGDTVSVGLAAFTYGFNELLSGISFLIAVIGLRHRRTDAHHGRGASASKDQRPRQGARRPLETIATMPRYWVTLLAQQIIVLRWALTPRRADSPHPS